MKTRWISLIVLLAMAVAGCTQGGSQMPREPQSPPSINEPAAPPEDPSPNATQPVEISPLSTPTPDSPPQGDAMPKPSDPELQKLIETTVQDLAKRLSVSEDQIELKEATEVTWPDSSLGCPNPGSFYTQALTPGYLIRLQNRDTTFEYHTDKRGLVIYCEYPFPLPLDSLPDR